MQRGIQRHEESCHGYHWVGDQDHLCPQALCEFFHYLSVSILHTKPHQCKTSPELTQIQRPMLTADWRRTKYHTLHYLLLTEDSCLPWKLDPKVACKFSQWQSASDSTLVWDSGAAMQHNGEIATNPAQSGTTFMDIKQLALQKETTS